MHVHMYVCSRRIYLLMYKFVCTSMCSYVHITLWHFRVERRYWLQTMEARQRLVLGSLSMLLTPLTWAANSGGID